MAATAVVDSTVPSSGRRKVVDPVTGQEYEVDAQYAYMDQADPFATGEYSAGDIARLDRQGAANAAIVGGAGLAGRAAQVGLTLVDTPQDTFNKKRLADLEKREANNDLGLEAGDRMQAEHTLLDPVRAALAWAKLAPGQDHLGVVT